MSRIVAEALNHASGPAPAGVPSREEVWQTYLERTPSHEMEKEKMLLLLDRNEWNIARVARLMNVTRRTIYLRLQRWGIPREKVRKTKPRAVKPAHA
jgi:transcriptional regulator of acetoin/glycerol metabolism